MSIEKLVEECGEALCALIYKEGAWATIDAEDRRLYLRDARAAIRRTLEFAAGEIYPTHRRACACTRCDCGNSGDAQSVADWDAREDCSNRLRSLASMENTRADT